MEKVFSTILDMSLTGSLVIGLVMLVRLFLRRQPKIFSYALWAVVLFRLLCPVSISASISALNVTQPQIEPRSGTVSRVSYVSAEPITVPAATQSPQTAAPAVEKTTVKPMTVAAWVWLAGVGVMACYSLVSFANLRRKLVGATPWQGNIYLSDYVDSPFVLGVLSPKIYLPTQVPEEERRFVVAHEQHHIRRLDHVWKLLAFLALCLHWFNPLVWLSFVLAGKDMEMSCDEGVIQKLGSHLRGDYAQTLLGLTSKRTIIHGTPLAFGEGDTKGRVKNMAKWKKPKVWVSILCAAICIAVLAACALNPKKQTESKYVPAEAIQVTIDTPEGYTYDPNTMYITRDSDGKLVGGLDIYPIPEGVYDPKDKYFDWLYQVGIPDLEAELTGELLLNGGMSGFSNYDWGMNYYSGEADKADRTVYRSHFFHVVEGCWVYDVWEDDLEVDVNTLSGGFSYTIVSTDSTAVSKQASVEVPQGYSYNKNSGDITRDSDGKLVGGLEIYMIPDGAYDPDDSKYLWLYKVGIPDLDAELAGELYCEGGITGFSNEKMWIMEFTQKDGDTEEKTVHRRHYFYVANDHVYDVWEDDLEVEVNTFDSVLRLTEEKTDGTAIAPEPMGDNMYRQAVESPLPDGYVFVNEELMTDEESMKTSDQPHSVVGGLTRYDIPDTVDWTDATFGFLKELGIPDVDDPSLAKVGGPESYCDWLLEVFSDVPEGEPQTVHRYHEFNVVVNQEGHATLFDMWFDATQIEYSQFAGFLSFPYMQAPEADTGETDAFDLCMQVVANVSAASRHLHSEAEGPDGATVTVDSYQEPNGDCLHIEQVDGSYQEAYMVVGEEYFYGAGAIGGALEWEAITPEEYSSLTMQKLWLGTTNLLNSGATYMGTMVEDEGPLYVYEFPEAYSDSRWGTAEKVKFYQVGFQFDDEGNFLRVNIAANTGTEKSFFAKEAIVTLDEDTVCAAIDREYARTPGRDPGQTYPRQRIHHTEQEKNHH